MKRRFRVVRQRLAARLAALKRAIKHDLNALTPLRIVEGAVLLFLVTQFTVLGINDLNSDKPILGLRFEGYVIGRLGGDFKERASAIVHDHENKDLSVKVADETSVITLRQLGVGINEKQVYASLLAPGRTGSTLNMFADQNLALLGIRNVPLGSPNFNTKLAEEYVATLDKKVDIAPTNAHFVYKDKEVIVESDANGQVIDADAAVEALRNASPATNTPVVLPIKQVSATVTLPMLYPLLSEAQAVAEKPLTITAGSSQVTLSPEQLTVLIVPKVTPDPENKDKLTAKLSFDEARLNAILDGVLKQAVVASKPTVMNGSTVVQQGTSGVRTEDGHSLVHILSALVQRQTGAAMPGKVDIPLVAVSPSVVQQVVNNALTRTGTGLVRLTFDDGPGAYTEQVLDILKRHNVSATFYVIGVNVQRYPGTMQRIKNEGHAIGNHSFSHANLARLSRAGVVQELSSTRTAIQQACGVTPTAFRPPYGAHNRTVREVATSMGMSIDMWSVDTRDWAQPGSGVITNRVLAGTGPGAVVLMHVLNQQTVNALPSIIEGIRRQGFTLE